MEKEIEITREMKIAGAAIIDASYGVVDQEFLAAQVYSAMVRIALAESLVALLRQLSSRQ